MNMCGMVGSIPTFSMDGQQQEEPTFDTLKKQGQKDRSKDLQKENLGSQDLKHAHVGTILI